MFYERLLTKLVVCILAAVLTVSPKRQYRGTLRPTTPAATGPEWIPAKVYTVQGIVLWYEVTACHDLLVSPKTKEM